MFKKKEKKQAAEADGDAVKAEFDAWHKKFAAEEIGEDIEVQWLKRADNDVEFSMKFVNEEEAHKFTVTLPTGYGGGGGGGGSGGGASGGGGDGGALTYATDDDELGDWLVHMVSQSNLATLTAALGEAARHYYSMEDDGFGDAGDGDDDGFGDDELFGDDTAPPVTVSKPPTSKETDVKLDAGQFRTHGGSKMATERLIKDLQQVCETETKQFGYEVEPIDDDLYRWRVKLYFAKSDSKEFYNDLQRRNIAFVEMEVKFPSTYPFDPPFLRVVQPRFAFHTGRITVGGSVCHEILTRSGWRPANNIESLLVQVRTDMIAGGARLDNNNRSPYSEAEAKAAFDRVARQHGWL